jgi:hypothetical protein
VRKTIAELEEGMAGVVVGTVHAIPGVAPLRSPARDVACLGYHLDVRDAQFDDRLRFRQLYDEARCVALEVRDETGAIRIDPAGLELAITDGPVTLYRPPYPRPLLDRVPRAAYLPAVTVEEGLLHDGAKILVCGLVARDVSVADDYRRGTETRVLRASPTFPLVASTDPDLFVAGARPIAPEELRRR